MQFQNYMYKLLALVKVQLTNEYDPIYFAITDEITPQNVILATLA